MLRCPASIGYLSNAAIISPGSVGADLFESDAQSGEPAAV
jgi:hypothetical protein